MAVKIFLLWAVMAWPACWAQPGGAAAPLRCENQERLFGNGTDIKTTADQVRRVTTVDFDGDSDIDVFTASNGDNIVSFFENEGGTPPALSEFIVDDQAAGVWEVAVADLDADGVKDVVVAAEDAGFFWYKFSGTFPYTFDKINLTTAAAGAISVDVGDLDGDGDVDIVYAAWDDSTIGWFENLGADGSYAFVEHVVSTTALNAIDVKTADINSDGAVDLLVASYEDDVVQ